MGVCLDSIGSVIHQQSLERATKLLHCLVNEDRFRFDPRYRLWPGKQIAEAEFLYRRHDQDKSILDMPEC